MYKIINEYEFRNAFMSSDTYKNNFTYGALTALYNYLIELETSENDGEECHHEFDMVAICCEWTEYESAVEAYEAHTGAEALTLDEEQSLEWLNDRTQVIEFDETYTLGDKLHGSKGVIVANF